MDVPAILKEREGDNLGVMVKIENVVILKEREGDNLGVILKIENVIILKEREGDNLGVILKMGNSLNEVLPFLLQMVTYFRNSKKWK